MEDHWPPHETIGQTQPMAYVYHMAEDHVTRENSGSNQELDLNPEMSRASHVGRTWGTINVLLFDFNS